MSKKYQWQKDLRKAKLEIGFLKSQISHLNLKYADQIQDLEITNYSDLVQVFNQFFCLDMHIRLRTREIVIARQMYYKFLSIHTELSLQSMARTLMCGHDHSTIIHALDEFDNKIKIERPYAYTWEKLNKFLADKFPQFDWNNLTPHIDRQILDPAI